MAIDYTKVGWDTTKYVNPTNMNQMDDGIKAACDGVDTLDTTAVKTSKAGEQVISNTNGSTALAIRASNSSRAYLDLYRTTGALYGRIGVTSSNVPVFNDGTSDYILLRNGDGYAWQLQSGTPITATAEEHADLNTFITPGTYYLSSATGGNVDNRPVTATSRFTLIAQRIGNTSARIRQIFLLDGTAYMYVRFTTNAGTSWSPWFNYAVNTDLDSYVKKSDSAIQTITNTGAGRTVLVAKSGVTTGALIAFQDKNGTDLGWLGANSSNKPIFWDSTEHELLQLDTLKSVVAASTDFANFKTRIAAL